MILTVLPLPLPLPIPKTEAESAFLTALISYLYPPANACMPTPQTSYGDLL